MNKGKGNRGTDGGNEAPAETAGQTGCSQLRERKIKTEWRGDKKRERGANTLYWKKITKEELQFL